MRRDQTVSIMPYIRNKNSIWYINDEFWTTNDIENDQRPSETRMS